MGGFIDQDVRKQSEEFSKSGKTIKVVGFDKQKPFSYSIVADCANESGGIPHLNPQLNPHFNK